MCVTSPSGPQQCSPRWTRTITAGQVAEVRIERAAEKDLKRMGPGPKRIGDYRVCSYRIQRDGPSGPVTIYAVEHIAARGTFDAVAPSLTGAALPEQR